MKTHKSYYSIIQYCPDLSRLEAANIGVLLFCPELNFLQALTDEAEARVRKFFGAHERKRGHVTVFRRAIEARLQVEEEHFRTLADVEEFISRRANSIQLTVPRPVKVHDPAVQLRELFTRLVADGAQANTKAPKTRIAHSVRKVLNQVFTDESIEPLIAKNLVINVPAFHQQLKVPFGYQNGSFNLIQPVRFDNKGEDAASREASFHALAGQSLAAEPDARLGELQLTVVAQFAPEQQETKEMVSTLLREHNVKLFALDNIDQLVEEIRTTGKPLKSRFDGHPK